MALPLLLDLDGVATSYFHLLVLCHPLIPSKPRVPRMPEQSTVCIIYNVVLKSGFVCAEMKTFKSSSLRILTTAFSIDGGIIL